jgi:hypothetical protein
LRFAVDVRVPSFLSCQRKRFNFEFCGSEDGRGLLFNISVQTHAAAKELPMPSQWLKQWFPHLPNALERAPMASLMCAGALLLGVALAGARSPFSHDNEASTADAVANAAICPTDENRETAAALREGAKLVEQTGQFAVSGERVVFVATDGQRRFIVLENLSLEGVAKALDGNPAAARWTVSGKVTEFRGAYYLLLSNTQRIP